MLGICECFNLNDEQQQEIYQLKSSYANLPKTIVSGECGETGCISERSSLITEAVIGMRFGQGLWRSIDVPEHQLTDALTHFALVIIACRCPSLIDFSRHAVRKQTSTNFKLVSEYGCPLFQESSNTLAGIITHGHMRTKSSKPPPRAKPLIAATLIFGKLAKRSTKRCTCLMR